MKAVMDQYIYSLRRFHQIRHHSLAPPIECWLNQGILPRWNWLETKRNDYLIPTNNEQRTFASLVEVLNEWDTSYTEISLHLPQRAASKCLNSLDCLLRVSIMERWVRRNPFIFPVVLFGLQFGLSVGRKLYKIKTGEAQDDQVVPSPLKSLLPKLSEEDAASLPYPPDAYPGSRDVMSPYGSLRVYEWGPEDGRKVLLVHGISNPCIALGAIAHGLADKGCRVMMFDLPGRGWSDTPVPTPHSTRLYTTTILLALTSSPLAWTGNGETFSLIGYSLGGGVVANFTSYFPSLVSSLVLLAPAGLVRQNRITLLNKILYNTGLINETTLEKIIRRRMRREEPLIRLDPKEKPSIETAVGGEMPKESEKNLPVQPTLSPQATVSGILPWQLDNHPGYVKSFMSSIRYGPITGQHAYWQRIAERLTAQNASSEGRHEIEGLQNGKVLIIAGHKDVIIVEDELVEDATEILGENNVRFELVDAGHELAVSKSKEILDFIFAFWEKDS